MFGNHFRQYQKKTKIFSGEKWIGLDALHQITNQQPHKLVITMTDFDQKEYQAVYNQFEVTLYKMITLYGALQHMP